MRCQLQPSCLGTCREHEKLMLTPCCDPLQLEECEERVSQYQSGGDRTGNWPVNWPVHCAGYHMCCPHLLCSFWQPLPPPHSTFSPQLATLWASLFPAGLTWPAASRCSSGS